MYLNRETNFACFGAKENIGLMAIDGVPPTNLPQLASKINGKPRNLPYSIVNAILLEAVLIYFVCVPEILFLLLYARCRYRLQGFVGQLSLFVLFRFLAE